ncbi:MAG TPA: DNA recombination protein RmuC, partial [Pseudomonas sp.]|nr:DNA recombination protein RmuC [Pseudomonas sp.]
MAVDLTSIVLGLVAGALPCLGWALHLQRRHAARYNEQALLQERLGSAQLAQAG